MNFKLFYTALLMCTCIATICSFFGQILLAIVNFNMKYYFVLVFLAFPVLILTKKLNKYFQTSHINIPYFLSGNVENVSFFFPIIIIFNTLLAHLSGMSVGREGVAVQIGGSCGVVAGKCANFTSENKEFLLSLGMIAGFSALFHTWVAAIIFIVELIFQRHKKIPSFQECLYFIIFSFYSSFFSTLLGLEKFALKIDGLSFMLLDYVKIMVFTLLIILLAIIFIVLQKKLKKINSKIWKIVLLVLIIILIVISEGRYNSLGTNFINGIFNSNYDFQAGDFLLKLVLTILCTGIGFSGGEVTNLFSIGALFGVFYATTFNMPILILASLGYVLMFCASARVWLTAIFLAYEVFGVSIALLIIIPSLLIPLINKKSSIY